MLVLDHHKTAQEALQGFDVPNVAIHFDMERSGAGLAWDHFYPGDERPFLVNYVEDRDLWRKKLPDTDVVNAYIGTLPFTFEAYEGALVTSAQDGWEVADPLSWAKMMGRGALARVQQYTREVVKNARMVDFEGHRVPLVNAPQVGISELLDALAQGHPFAMGWWQRADGVFQYSLRSRGDFDVSALAKKLGGGGHKSAAGFQVHHSVHQGMAVEESQP
jgi:oligoribonuclease NrnB/cAMP/cGMP phosphodiesterase (DHH superfamily)